MGRKSGSSKKLSLIPTKDIVPIPGLILPLFIARGANASALERALKRATDVVLALDTGPEDQKTKAKDICSVGAIGSVVHSILLASGDLKIRVSIQRRVIIEQFVKESPTFVVQVKETAEDTDLRLTKADETLMESVREKFAVLGQFDPALDEYIATAGEMYHPGELADLIITVLPLQPLETQRALEEFDPRKRLDLVAQYLTSHIDTIAIKERIANRAQTELGRAHHQELLREQLRQIQVELGEEPDTVDDLSDLSKQLVKVKMPANARSEAEKQIRRLKQLHPDTSEAALARTYLDWILDLPWLKRTKDRLDLIAAKEILESDHYGLEKTKERILDFLGVRKLKKQSKGPVLLLVGPPGVGKTSLGRSIARALGREFVRVSLGGLRDEAELRGHRRTYVGALPGRIIQGLKTAGTKNPVFMLDELDKVGADFRGDPASVLLEILDPEQNRAFEDHYLNIPFDLSEVMFIGTANVTDTVPGPLLDRMEVIEIAGYTNEEKLQIARRYIVPRMKDENGLEQIPVTIPDDVITHLISGYTRESGVRELGRVTSTVLRKVARMVAEGKEPPTEITEKLTEDFLGPLKYMPDKKQAKDEIGVVQGLAWTPVGGEVLLVEASITPGKGALSLTGQMGEVMRESAMTALTYILSNAAHFGIDAGFYETSNVHMHIPQGAIPKDGPSAGVAMATALLSLIARRPVSRDVAMTGEITLRGSVLPIGGLKEKALAALRIGVPTVIIPKENARELVEFPEYLLNQVKFVAVENLEQVFEVALSGGSMPRRSERLSSQYQRRHLPPLPSR